MGESAGYRSWVVSRVVGFLPRLKPWASSLYSCEHRFPSGTYAYVGSALGSGGFSRVDRHRRVARGDHDVRHWHVDYLLGHPDSRLRDVVRSHGVDVECAVADRLPDGPVARFGSSDCNCRTHLAVLDGDAAARDRLERVHRAVVPDD